MQVLRSTKAGNSIEFLSSEISTGNALSVLQLLSCRPGERPCSLQELPLAALLPDSDKETVLGKSITPQFTPPVSVYTSLFSTHTANERN